MKLGTTPSGKFNPTRGYLKAKQLKVPLHEDDQISAAEAWAGFERAKEQMQRRLKIKDWTASDEANALEAYLQKMEEIPL